MTAVFATDASNCYKVGGVLCGLALLSDCYCFTFPALYMLVLAATSEIKRAVNNNNNNNNKSETIQHITAACEQLAPTEYVQRHDGLAKIIHQKLAEAAELIDDKCPYYKYTPANVLKNENFKPYWNCSILTDKTIPCNRLDITFMNKKTKNTFW